MTTDTSNDPTTTAEWTILYHAPGKFKGRGEFLRLMLEDAGITDYVNTDKGLYGPEGSMDMFRGTDPQAVKTLPVDDDYWPMLYPPALVHRPTQSGSGDDDDNKATTTVMINQVGACMIYLGEQLGYAPTTGPAETARANAILMNVVDYIADGRSSFHPVDNKMSYHDQKEQGDRVSKAFTEERMKKYLYHFNKIILVTASRRNSRSTSPPQPIAGGPNLTYADFALFHALDATIAQFNTEFYDYVWDKLDDDMTPLKEYHAWIKARPNLVSYFASDRCAPWAGDSMM